MGRHRKKPNPKRTGENVSESRQQTDEVESGYEDDMDSPEEAEEIMDSGPISKKPRLQGLKIENSSQSRKGRPATLEELTRYASNQIGQHSALLEMQLAEMLKEIDVKEKHTVQINKWKNGFTKFVSKMKTSKSYELRDLKWMEKKGLVLPLPTMSKWPCTKGTFIFVAPSEVAFVGSFASNLITTHSRIVDVALVLPEECMERKDLMNCRWILRRALYLTWLGNALRKKSDLVEDVSWFYQFGSPLRPVLQITPKGPLEKKWKFNIYAVPPENFFKLSHISPVRNNIRHSWFYNKEIEEGDDGNVGSPTPNYNWACGVDVLMMEQNKFIVDNISYKEWIKGIKLLKIWLAQRGLNGADGVSSHVINLLVIYLIKNRKISVDTHPYQVFRSTLLAIIKSDWTINGITLSKEETPKDTNEALLRVSDFHKPYPVVFVDPSGYFNLVSNLSAERFKEIQLESQKAIDFLESSDVNHFECLFILKVDFGFNYDQFLKLTLTEEHISTILQDHSYDAEAELVDHLGDVRNPAYKVLMSILAKAFADRVLFIACREPILASLPFNEAPKPLDYSVTIGLSINQEKLGSVLTKGPSAETREAKSFREFWGDIVTLRRFQDSTFHEAILWCDVNSPVADKRLLLGKIAKYILQNQLKIEENCVCCIDKQLEDSIRMPAYPESLNYGTGEEANSAVIVAFDTLSKKLRKLKLTLPISTIQSPSEILRHSQVFPPISRSVLVPHRSSAITSTIVTVNEAYGCPFYREVIEVQLILEISGKWPDELLSIQAMKVQFLFEMHKLLEVEATSSVLFPSYLEISWEGYIFRVRVNYRKEIQLNRIVDLPNGEYKEEETEASIALEKQTELLPLLTSSLNSLQTDFPSFSGSVRLVKRWCGTQMLIPHLPAVVVDLLVAYLFIHPYPHRAPATPHIGLLRFLKLVSQTDWKTTPIVINFRKQFSGSDQCEILTRFNSRREAYPPLFIASPFELRNIVELTEPTDADLNRRFRLLSLWSKTNPSLIVLNRMKILAETALQWYENNVYSLDTDFKILFRPSLKDYDVTIYLHQKELARRLESVDTKKVTKIQPYEYSKGERFPAVQFDPVQYYLRELRSIYEGQALFFFNDQGGDVIGVVWTQKALRTKDARVSSIRGHKLMGYPDVKQVSNIDAFIEDFKILGDGLLKMVTLKT